MGETLSAWRAGTAAGGGSRRWLLHRQLKRPFFGRFAKPWRWPQDIATEGWERHTVASRSHATLATLLRRTAHPPRGIVVCAHPMGVAAKGFWLRNGHAAALLDAGWHVVAFDFNGFGESTSTNFDWPGDVVSVGRWAAERFPGLPVHALTASFGAMHTVNALGDEGFPFRAVIAEGCPPSLPDFWKHYPAAHAILQSSRLVMPRIEKRLRPVAAISRQPEHVRILLVHSRGDDWTPVAHGATLAAAAPAGRDVRRLVLQRAEHTHGMRDERETYLPAVLAFLAEP